MPFRYGRHACTQYSSFGLTKDWYSFNIILLSLFTLSVIGVGVTTRVHVGGPLFDDFFYTDRAEI